MLGALQWDSTDLLTLHQEYRFLPCDKGEQAADSRQAGVARTGGAPPRLFEVIEESEHERFGKIFHGQEIHRFVEAIRSVTEQQFDRIAVDSHGVDREPFLHRQIVAEESFQQGGQGMSHDRSP